MMSPVDPQSLKLLYSQWIILTMSFSCYFIMQCQNIIMSITLIHMIDWNFVNKGKIIVCKGPGKTELSALFRWSHILQSQILASVLYGMALMHFPAELIAKRVKYKWLPLVGTGLASLCSFLIPVFAKIDGYSVIALQVIKAVAQSLIRPAFNLLIEQWVETKSVHNYMSYAETGFFVSGFLSLLIAGILCSSPDFGWQYAFYFSGAMGVVWCTVWFYFVSEYCYPTALIYGSEPNMKPKSKVKCPWFRILSSLPVMAYILVGMAYYWAYSFNLLLIPLYLKSVFDADTEWITIISAVPSLLGALLFILATFITERFVVINVLEKVHVRKICVTLGLLTFAGSNMLLTFTNCGKEISSLILIIGIGFKSFVVSALINLPLDMSPQFAGFLTGIMHTVGAITGSFLPLLVALLSDSKEGLKYWYKVFNASVLWSVIGTIIFLAFGSSEVQPFDEACTIQPYRTRSIGIPPLIFKNSTNCMHIIVPESSSTSLGSSSTVNMQKLSELLESESMRRTNSPKKLFTIANN